jgi:hypothetical protein
MSFTKQWPAPTIQMRVPAAVYEKIAIVAHEKGLTLAESASFVFNNPKADREPIIKDNPKTIEAVEFYKRENKALRIERDSYAKKIDSLLQAPKPKPIIKTEYTPGLGIMYPCAICNEDMPLNADDIRRLFKKHEIKLKHSECNGARPKKK